MNKAAWSIGLVLYVIAVYIALPVVLVWGWVRWVKRTQRLTVSVVLSLIGFTFATLSCLLAISSVLYGYANGCFAYYDPRLLRIFRCGLLLSLAGLGFGISGVWRPSPLRWHAPASATRMLLFWFASAISQ